MDKSRVPRTLYAFDLYIKRVNNFIATVNPSTLQSHGERLGMTVQEISRAGDFLAQWHTGNPASRGIYELHTNPDTKTKTTRNTVVNIMREFASFFSPLLTRMSGSSTITEEDYIALNIGKPNPHRTRNRQPLSETAFAAARAQSGGDVHFSFRTLHDTKRPSKAATADSIELAFKIGTPAPAHVLDGTEKRIFTRASIVLRTGQESEGKKLFYSARWYDTKHPGRAGPWSSIKSVTIA